MPAVDLVLPENLTVSQAHSLHDDFEALLSKDNTEELVVHADKVNRADTAGLQLVLALVSASKERQIEITWKKPSQKLVEVAEILGLNNALGMS